jgi:glutathione synthase/RimK-type ligase-like ATP-grasp enzyme
MKYTVVGRGEDARNIAEALACKRFAFKSATDGIIIRYGNVRTINARGYEAHPRYEINTIEAINNARNKYKSLGQMKKGGCRVPEALAVMPIIPNNSTDVWFGRTFYHHKGLDIKVCKTNRDIENAINAGSEYFVKYIPIGKEYRYHVFGDKILQACIKFKEAGNGGVGNEDDIIRNLEHGWKFAEIEPQPKASEYAIKACRALGLHFGAVDIIEELDHTKLYVLEVNTAPGLDNKRLEAYTTAFKEYINKVSNPNDRKACKVIIPQWFQDFAHNWYNTREEFAYETHAHALLHLFKQYQEHINATA